jgi:hypothetical protein
MWSKVGERSMYGPYMIKEAEEQVAKVWENLKAAQSRQKSYADTRRRPLKFQPGKYAYLSASPIRGTRRFQVRGKLVPQYIGPYRIIKKIGAVAYQLELPLQMVDVHDIFHISQLKKCLSVPEEQAPIEAMDFSQIYNIRKDRLGY